MGEVSGDCSAKGPTKRQDTPAFPVPVEGLKKTPGRQRSKRPALRLEVSREHTSNKPRLGKQRRPGI
jgi:hypothetical protein